MQPVINQTKWQKIIAELKEKGWKQTEIGDACRISQSAITQLNSGSTKEPRHSIGEKIIALLDADKEQVMKDLEHEL